jgi:hypothetical protein
MVTNSPDSLKNCTEEFNATEVKLIISTGILSRLGEPDEAHLLAWGRNSKRGVEPKQHAVLLTLICVPMKHDPTLVVLHPLENP